MTRPPFGFADARAILEPYLAQAQQRETARLADARREAERGAGVAWSALGPEAPGRRRTRDELRDEARAALARDQAFAGSPRGRFLASLRALEELGYGSAAERARAAFTRGFADPERTACPAEIGTALTALARLDRAEARAACMALSELLIGALTTAAA